MTMAGRELLYREFGLLLATERKRKHLSQAGFAELVGMSRTSISNIECGRQPIQLHQLYMFSSRLNVTPESLLPRQGLEQAKSAPTDSASQEQARYLEQARRLLNRRART